MSLNILFGQPTHRPKLNLLISKCHRSISKCHRSTFKSNRSIFPLASGEYGFRCKNCRTTPVFVSNVITVNGRSIGYDNFIRKRRRFITISRRVFRGGRGRARTKQLNFLFEKRCNHPLCFSNMGDGFNLEKVLIRSSGGAFTGSELLIISSKGAFGRLGLLINRSDLRCRSSELRLPDFVDFKGLTAIPCPLKG